MAIYLTPEFDKERRNARINDDTMRKVAKSITAGLMGDRLCQYTFKKRIGLPGVSSRDGARAIIVFNDGSNVFFFDIYLKSQLSKKRGKELENDEIDAYCRIAKDFIALSMSEIQLLLDSKNLLEVTENE